MSHPARALTLILSADVEYILHLELKNGIMHPPFYLNHLTVCVCVCVFSDSHLEMGVTILTSHRVIVSI